MTSPESKKYISGKYGHIKFNAFKFRSMDKAISETNRRREKQEEYNKLHNITPQTIKKSVREVIKATIVEDLHDKYDIDKDESIEDIISKLTDEMLKYAQEMEFEKAAELRDKIKELENMVEK